MFYDHWKQNFITLDAISRKTLQRKDDTGSDNLDKSDREIWIEKVEMIMNRKIMGFRIDIHRFEYKKIKSKNNIVDCKKIEQD